MKPNCVWRLVRHGLRIVLVAISLAVQPHGCIADDKAVAANLDPLLQAIKKSGEPVTLAELDAWYVTPPADQNAAPVYAQAFAAIAETNSKSPGFLTSNREALKLLHQAGTRPACRYPIDLKLGIQTMLPHLRNFKPASRLLKEEAIQSAGQGRTDASSGYCIDGFKLAQSLSKEPLLVSHLVRSATIGIAVSAVEESLTLKPWSELQLPNVQTAVRELRSEDTTSLDRTLAGERCIALVIVQEIVQLPPQEIEKWIQEYRKTVGPAGDDSESWPDPKNVDAAVIKSELSYMLNNLNLIKSSAARSLTDGLVAAAKFETQMKPAEHPLTSISIAGGFSKSVQKSALGSAVACATDAGLAVERYRLANRDSLPDALEQLVPKYLSAVPTDPFDGKRIRYKKLSPKGYAVYSVGPNLKDDGGTPRPPLSPIGGDYDTTFTVKR